MSGVDIRRADTTDIDLLMEWRERVIREVFRIPQGKDIAGLLAANRDYYTDALADGSHLACLAWGGDKVVGCGGVCLQREMPSPDNPSGRCAYLMDIYVCPEERGRGNASKIVSWLIARADENGAGKIYLETTDAARRLYQKAGFVPMEDLLCLKREGETV